MQWLETLKQDRMEAFSARTLHIQEEEPLAVLILAQGPQKYIRVFIM